MCPSLGVNAIETGPTVTILNNVLTVLIYLTSILLTLTILMHKGQGGGLSDMFGGGISSSAGSSGVAERNLNRITLGTLLVWVICIICYALLVKYGSTPSCGEPFFCGPIGANLGSFATRSSFSSSARARSAQPR